MIKEGFPRVERPARFRCRRYGARKVGAKRAIEGRFILGVRLKLRQREALLAHGNACAYLTWSQCSMCSVQEPVPHLLFYSVLLNRTVFYWLREAIRCTGVGAIVARSASSVNETQFSIADFGHGSRLGRPSSVLR